jgi:hypothetical protein
MSIWAKLAFSALMLAVLAVIQLPPSFFRDQARRALADQPSLQSLLSDDGSPRPMFRVLAVVVVVVQLAAVWFAIPVK